MSVELPRPAPRAPRRADFVEQLELACPGVDVRQAVGGGLEGWEDVLEALVASGDLRLVPAVHADGSPAAIEAPRPETPFGRWVLVQAGYIEDDGLYERGCW